MPGSSNDPPKTRIVEAPLAIDDRKREVDPSRSRNLRLKSQPYKTGPRSHNLVRPALAIEDRDSKKPKKAQPAIQDIPIKPKDPPKIGRSQSRY